MFRRIATPAGAAVAAVGAYVLYTQRNRYMPEARAASFKAQESGREGWAGIKDSVDAAKNSEHWARAKTNARESGAIAKDAVEKTADRVGDKLRDGTQAVKESARDGYESAKEGVRDTVEAVKDGARTVKNRLS